MEIDSPPSAEHPFLNHLDAWLEAKETSHNRVPPYYHLFFHQQDDIRPEVWDEIYDYINHAHEGARRALRAPLGDSLHPWQHDTPADPAFGYPHRLPINALQAFFGEIMAGIVAEYYGYDEEQHWEVPVYLFRTHLVLFQQLERMRQAGNWERNVVGRTGDDGLAFARDEKGIIVAWLACEAKCTRTHSSNLIADNHIKLSQPETRPVDLPRLILALEDYRDDDYSRTWIAALRTYYWALEHSSQESCRCDLSVYVYGISPQRKHTWIPTDRPHVRYSGGRKLISSELHLPQVDTIIRELYGRMEGSA